MTLKELLIKEIESTPDTILAETLDFLCFLKTKETQIQTNLKLPKPNITQIPGNSTGSSLLEHLKTIGTWEGDDLQDCLQLVYATRGKAKFDDNNPFE
jgi:hypothetical protein